MLAVQLSPCLTSRACVFKNVLTWGSLAAIMHILAGKEHGITCYTQGPKLALKCPHGTTSHQNYDEELTSVACGNKPLCYPFLQTNHLSFFYKRNGEHPSSPSPLLSLTSLLNLKTLIRIFPQKPIRFCPFPCPPHSKDGP